MSELELPDKAKIVVLEPPENPPHMGGGEIKYYPHEWIEIFHKKFGKDGHLFCSGCSQNLGVNNSNDPFNLGRKGQEVICICDQCNDWNESKTPKKFKGYVI